MVIKSAYRGVTECLSEHVYNAHIQYVIYTTCQYNTQIEKLNRKEKLALIGVIKGGTYIRIGLGFSLYSPKKLTRREEEIAQRQNKLKTGK